MLLRRTFTYVEAYALVKQRTCPGRRSMQSAFSQARGEDQVLPGFRARSAPRGRPSRPVQSARSLDDRRVQVLFAHRRSFYFHMPVDAWDERRDARGWNVNGPGGPVIAHPPCRLWCRLRGVSTAPRSEAELGFLAISAVRSRGGVLEHPAHSKLWEAAGLPRPGAEDEFGFTLPVSQKWWGHRAEKPTWLYVCGLRARDIPELPFSLGAPSHVVGGRGPGGFLNDDEADLTPPAFAWWLEELASRTRSRVLAEAAASESGSSVSPGQSLMDETKGGV